MSVWRRAIRFYLVGAAGAMLQLAAVGALVHGARIHYGIATAAAICIALAHNFMWHARWTWRDRRPAAGYVAALATFVAGNGGVSFAGSAVAVPLLVEGLGLPPVLANAGAIVACGLLNFWMASRVFPLPAALSVVPELQLDAEVPGPQKTNGVLELVLRGR